MPAVNTPDKSSRFASFQSQPSRAALALAAALAALPAVQAQPFTVSGSVMVYVPGGPVDAIPPTSGQVWNLPDRYMAVGSGIYEKADGAVTVAEGGALFVKGMAVGSRSWVVGNIVAIRFESGGDGEVTVTGVNSAILNSEDLKVASSSVGRLTISNGAEVLNANAYIARSSQFYSAEGYVTVTGAGSSWISTGDLTVGGGSAEATGSVLVENGASAWVGGTTTLTNQSTLTLDGGRLRLNGYNREADATLTYQSGVVQLGGDRTVGSDAAVTDFFGTTQGPWGPSTVIEADKHLVIEGKATVQGALAVEEGASFVVGAPTTEFAPSATGVVVNSTLTLHYGEIIAEEGMQIASTGTVDGMGNVTGDVVNAGHIAPSNLDDASYPGWFDVYGSFTQTDTGSISLRLLGGIDYDMFYAESLSLAGTLNILSVDGFMPEAGDTFQIFGFDNLVGAFDQINSFTLGEGLVWDFSQLYVNGSISTVAVPVTSIFINGAVTPSPATLPLMEWNVGSSLTVGISGTGSLAITAGGNVTSDAGYIGYGAKDVGTVNVTGKNAVWTNNGDLAVGESGTGTLTIAEGGKVYSEDGFVGYNAGSTGTVTVAGANSLWANSGMLVLGYDGDASLSIANGGAVTSARSLIAVGADSRASATVSGAGSSWAMTGDLEVGVGGEGALTIADGASVSNENGYIGAYAGSRGTVNVSGLGSTWTNRGALLVGNDGGGTLSIADGGQVTSAVGFVGYGAGSQGEVTVSGAGSSWASTGDLYVGRAGTGSLAIADGGTVSNQNGYLGYMAGSQGEVSLRGAGSSWTNRSDLVVGDSGVGSLDISGGAQASATNAYLGRNDGSESTVTVAGAGSRLNTTADLVVGGRSLGDSSASTASLTVRDGGAVNVGGSMAVHEGGTVAVSTHQAVTVAGNLVNNGVITVTAAHDLPAGSYTPISVGGAWSGSGSVQTVGGVWNSGTNQFVVAPPVTVAEGGVASFDLTETQRVDVTAEGGAVSIGLGSDVVTSSGDTNVRISVTSGGQVPIFEGQIATGTFTVSSNVDSGLLYLSRAIEISNNILKATGVLYDPAINRLSFVPATISGNSASMIASLARPGNRYSMTEASDLSFSVNSFDLFGGDDFQSLGGGDGFEPTSTLIFGFIFETAAIPEPASFGALIGLGALGTAALRRRRR